MKSLVRSSVAVVLAIAALALPAGASAAPASTAFAIAGYEYAFTSTVGSFAGTGLGNAGDRAVWNTSVEHDQLGSVPTYINGGSFQMVTRSPAGTFDTVTGTFAHHGGMITTLSTGPNCTNQRFQVDGELQDVATNTTSGGTGEFSVVLTHYRISLFGRCLIYSARVVGTVAFEYAKPS
jgi:hypothetical protein